MGLFEGKKGLIIGVANDRSIALAIAEKIMREGGQCGFTHLPDPPQDERRKNHGRVAKCLEKLSLADQQKFLVPLDVQNDQQIADVMATCQREFGQIDFLVHSVAYADRNDLTGETIGTSRAGFKMAMDISCYSLIAVANAAKSILADQSSIACMTYFGGEKIVPGYNVMGICKSALDATTRYLAHDLGPRGVRVNAVSAGPLKTLASAAVGAGKMLDVHAAVSPLGRNVSQQEVGNVTAFLLSDLASGITGEVLHVDAGYHAMGAPGRLLDQMTAN